MFNIYIGPCCLSPCSCLQTLSAHTPKALGTNKSAEADDASSKHSRKHEARPPRVKKEFRLDSNDFGFICAGLTNVGVI